MKVAMAKMSKAVDTMSSPSDKIKTSKMAETSPDKPCPRKVRYYAMNRKTLFI